MMLLVQHGLVNSDLWHVDDRQSDRAGASAGAGQLQDPGGASVSSLHQAHTHAHRL